MSAPAPAAVPLPAPRARIAPLSPERFALQATLGQETHDLLRYAQALLGHAVPSGDVDQVLNRALKLLVHTLERRKFAASARSRPGSRRRVSGSRYVPAAVRRAVWQRDGGQCTYVGDSGHRCASRSRLEFDHVDPAARGGVASAANLRLRCRAHNQYAAECAFGSEFMRHKREEARRRAAEARAAQEAARAREADEARARAAAAGIKTSLLA